MRQKIAIFKRENALCFNFVCHKELRAAELGGDASENGDFQSEKQRLQGTNFSRSFHFIFLIKIGGRCDRKCQFSKRETALAGCKNLKLNFDELKHLTIEILI